MSREEIIRHTVEERISDYLSRAYDSLCEQFGIDCFEWGYPYEDDAEDAEQKLTEAWSAALANATE